MPSRLRYASIASALTLAFLPVACDGDDDDGGSSGSTGDDHGSDDHGSDDDGSDDHGSDDEGSDDHGSDDHGDETAGGTPAESYCICVFAACHDAYHAKWGEDEVASRAACIAEAEALPVNGSPTMTGNFLECREHFCEEAEADESLCANALGDAVCL